MGGYYRPNKRQNKLHRNTLICIWPEISHTDEFIGEIKIPHNYVHWYLHMVLFYGQNTVAGGAMLFQYKNTPSHSISSSS